MKLLINARLLAQAIIGLSLVACGGANSPPDDSATEGTSVATSDTPAATAERVTVNATTEAAAAATPTAYEAESGTVSGGANIQDVSIASGGRIVGNIVNVGARASITVDGGSGGAATLAIRFANNYASGSKLSLYVNGVRQTQVAFAYTGGWLTFADLAALPVTLAAGSNTISLQHDSGDVGSADIDRLTITLSGTTTPPPPTIPTPIVTNYEAESGTVSGGANIQDVSIASGGRIVGNIVNVGARASITVDGGSGGAATLAIRFANNYASGSKLSLYVNGVRQTQVAFAYTGGWLTFADLAALPVTLVAGSNTISLQHDAADVGSADIDRLTITLGSTTPPPPPPPPPIPSPIVTIYEAESGTVSGGANIQSVSNASGGRIVGHIVDVGARVSITVGGGSSAGAASLVVRFANNYVGGSKLGLYVNGVRQTQLTLPRTGGWLTFVDSAAVPITLAAGNNTISLQHDASDVLSADIDRIVVTRSGVPDTQVPSRPSNLAISGLTCTSATLSWTASTDNVGVAFYDLYHDGQQMGSVSGSATSAQLTLTPGATWGLYVNARDAAGNLSQASATLPVTVPQCQIDTQAPTTPTNLVGTASGTTVNLTWSASTDNVAVVAYDVYRDNVKVGATAARAFTDSGLAANTTYQYAVAARDAQGNASARSVSASVTTGNSCSSVVCSTTEIASDADIPWGLVALPDGSVIYSRRTAHDLIRLDPVTRAKTNLGTVPNVQGTDGEGGLLGLAITPAFPATDPWIYIYHSSASDNRIVRIQYKNGRLDNSTLQVLLSGIGMHKYHNGGRLRFGPDGKLYAATGDAENLNNPQSTSSLNGKVLRLNVDGSVPADNPFGNYVWSLGHRNPQGLAFDSQGRLWEQEFGNSTMDETNLIQKGGNYGWPNCEGTQSVSGSGCGTSGYIAPKYTYATSEGSCSGIAIVRDVLFVACQRGTRMYRHVISGSSLTSTQQLFVGTYGRLRTVEPSIDGGLWLTTTNNPNGDSIPSNGNEKILKIVLR